MVGSVFLSFSVFGFFQYYSLLFLFVLGFGLYLFLKTSIFYCMLDFLVLMNFGAYFRRKKDSSWADGKVMLIGGTDLLSEVAMAACLQHLSFWVSATTLSFVLSLKSPLNQWFLSFIAIKIFKWGLLKYFVNWR